MSTNALRRYLQDHLAGSVAALQGKLALYRALEDVAPNEPRLGGYPFAALQARTLIQHAMVEQERMAAARAAFGDAGGSSGVDDDDGSGDAGEWGV